MQFLNFYIFKVQKKIFLKKTNIILDSVSRKIPIYQKLAKIKKVDFRAEDLTSDYVVEI